MTAEKKQVRQITEIDLRPSKWSITGNKKIAWVLVVVSLGLVAVGTQISWDIYDFTTFKVVTSGINLDIENIKHIPEFKLIEDATFSGVESINGKLYSNYDRTKKQGKKACPT